MSRQIRFHPPRRSWPLKEAGLFINLRVMGSPADAWMVVDAKKC